MFPSPEEKEKARQINQFYKLFRGKFGSVLRYFRTPEERRKSVEVIINLAGKVSRTFADLLFLEEPIITVADDSAAEEIAEIIDRNDLDEQLYESALAQSYAGVAYFEVSIKKDLAVIHDLNPETVFWQTDQRNIKGSPRKVVIAYYVTIDKKLHLFKKIHVPGSITYELWECASKEDKTPTTKVSVQNYDATLPDIEYTGLDEIPVFKIDNQKPGCEEFGISDLEDIMNLLEELTRVSSQIATQLKKHANARMAVPPGVLDENGKVKNHNLEMIEVAGNDEGVLQIPQYIVNQNPQLDMAFKEREEIMKDIANVAEVSTIFLDMNVTGGVEKVGALRLRILPTEAKVRRKRKPYKRGIRKMLAFAYTWETGKQIKATDIDVTFGNWLPDDPVEKANVESVRMVAGIQTKRDAIRNLDGIDGEALDKKIEELDKEEEAAAPAPAPAIAV